MRKTHNHDGSRPWRGVKRDNWEGGHRVPFLVRWPVMVKPSSVSDQIICQTDIMATCASLVGYDLPVNSAEDSFDISSALSGNANEPLRPYVLHQTISLALGIREGDWKYLDHMGSVEVITTETESGDLNNMPCLKRHRMLLVNFTTSKPIREKQIICISKGPRL